MEWHPGSDLPKVTLPKDVFFGFECICWNPGIVVLILLGLFIVYNSLILPDSVNPTQRGVNSKIYEVM